MNGETGASGGGGDQVDDYAIADQRFGAPILGDEGEQTVLDLIPLAGARGKVTDGDFDADLVGQMLQLALPQAQTGAIAAAPISGDEQSFGLGIANAADILPPATDGLYRKGCRVVVDAYADPASVGREIIDTIRHRPTQLLDQEVVDSHLFRLTFRPPRPNSLIRRSWPRTFSGCPCGRHSRPPFLKSQTSSFFLVSTEITGC